MSDSAPPRAPKRRMILPDNTPDDGYNQRAANIVRNNTNDLVAFEFKPPPIKPAPGTQKKMPARPLAPSPASAKKPAPSPATKKPASVRITINPLPNAISINSPSPASPPLIPLVLQSAPINTSLPNPTPVPVRRQSAPIDIPIPKKKGPHPNGISTLQQIQEQVRQLKLQNPGMKHREAIALAGANYREQNGTTRAHVKKEKKK